MMDGKFAIALKHGQSVLITEKEYEYWMTHVLPTGCFLTEKPSQWLHDWPVNTLMDAARKETE